MATTSALDFISLAQAKSWLQVDDSSSDDDITRLIKTAVDWMEKYTCWRTFQRTEIVYNRQLNPYVPINYFPDYGTGFYTGSPGIRWTPKGLSIYLYPFTIISVQDLSSPPGDVTYTTQINALKTLLYAAPNSIITLATGYDDPAKLPPTLLDACYKMIVYLFENRDMYPVSMPTDIQMLLNQYRRAII